MAETADKLKRVTQQLKRVLKENKEIRQEYADLEAQKAILEQEQVELQEIIDDKQAEIIRADVDFDQTTQVLEQKALSNKLAKPIQTNKAGRIALQEKLARSEMEWEDLLSRFTILKEISEEEQEKHLELKDIRNEYFFLLKKDEELKEKIKLLQPLLKEFILEIGDNNKSENSLDECINNLRKSLEDCLINEEKYQKAAKYDVKEHFQFERIIRQPLNKK